MPLSCVVGGGGRLVRPTNATLRLKSATRTHLSQQFRVLRVAALQKPPVSLLPRSSIIPKSYLPSRFTFAPSAMAGSQTRSHMGHHHHHHHHDNIYLTSTNKNDAAVRITRIGLFCNFGMFAAKLAGGMAFHSQAMVADAWHSFSDLGSDLLTWLTVSSSLKPPNETYPLGFGKVESLGALGVSGMLLFSGCYMFIGSSQALLTLWSPETQELLEGVVGHVHAHSHSHSHDHGGAPSLHAAWLAAGTVLVKEWLYHATMKVAKERKSAVLASNAVHHRVDSLTGIVTLFAILGANLLHNAAWLDPLGGLVISLLVIKAGWGNTVSALYELVDKSIDDEVKTSVRKHALRCIEGLDHSAEVELREVEGIKSGQNYLVDLLIAVPRSWTLVETQTVEDGVRSAVGAKVRGVRRVKVRFVALDDSKSSLFDEFIPGDVSPQPSPEPEEHDHDHDHDHEHDHDHGHGHKRANGSGKKTQ